MTSLKSVCDAYSRSADAYLRLIPRIREACTKHGLNLFADIRELDELEIDIHRFRRADCDPTFRVAVAGGFSVGKSQLINAILGQSLLPNEIRDTTFIPTVVRSSRGGPESIRVRYVTRGELKEILTAYARKSETRPWPVTTEEVERMSAEDVNRVVSSIRHAKEQEDFRSLLSALRSDLSANISHSDQGLRRPIDRKNLELFVHRASPNVEKFLASAAEIELPAFPLDDDVELIDLPGTDADDPWAREITHRFVREVDALILVSEADHVFTEAGGRIVDQVRAMTQRGAEKIFIVLNKADRYSQVPLEQVRNAFSQLNANLKERFPSASPRILLTSAVAKLPDAAEHEQAVTSLAQIEPQTGDERLDQLLGLLKEGGGIAGLVDALRVFRREAATELKRRSLTERWVELVDRVRKGIEQQSREAKIKLASGEQARVGRYLDEITKIERGVEEGVGEILAMVDVLKQDVARPQSAFAKRVGEIPVRLATKIAGGRDDHRDAGEAVALAWRDARESLSTLVSSAILDELLRPIVERGRELLAAPIARLPDVAAETGRHFTWVEFERNLIDGIGIRVAEALLADSIDHPFTRPPAGQRFGAWRARFVQEIQKLCEARIQQVLRASGTFLPFHLNWRMDALRHSTSTRCEQLRRPQTIAEHEARYRSLITDDEERQQGERNIRLAEVGSDFEMLVRPVVG